MRISKIVLDNITHKEIIIVSEGRMTFLLDSNLEPVSEDLLTFNKTILINKINEFEKRTGIKIDLTPILAEKDLLKKKILINQIIGKSFEDYLFNIISKFFNVKRNQEIFKSISKFDKRKYHNKPDFIIENKVIIEAKLNKINYNQIKQYSEKYSGIVAFPWSGECRVPKNWSCNFYTIYDPMKLIEKIRFYLNK